MGLGNPGPRYSLTRHNIGFIFLDLLAQEGGVSFSTTGAGKKSNAELCEMTLWGQSCLLVKPQTFMNLSGESLQALRTLGKVKETSKIICFHDEVDLPPGELRIKQGGSDAGHNGLKSMRASLGDGEFYRFRMGVGRPPRGSPIAVADYVLGKFTGEERDGMIKLCEVTAQSLEIFFKKGLQPAQMHAATNKVPVQSPS